MVGDEDGDLAVRREGLLFAVYVDDLVLGFEHAGRVGNGGGPVVADLACGGVDDLGERVDLADLCRLRRINLTLVGRARFAGLPPLSGIVSSGTAQLKFVGRFSRADFEAAVAILYDGISGEIVSICRGTTLRNPQPRLPRKGRAPTTSSSSCVQRMGEPERRLCPVDTRPPIQFSYAGRKPAPQFRSRLRLRPRSGERTHRLEAHPNFHRPLGWRLVGLVSLEPISRPSTAVDGHRGHATLLVDKFHMIKLAKGVIEPNSLCPVPQG